MPNAEQHDFAISGCIPRIQQNELLHTSVQSIAAVSREVPLRNMSHRHRDVAACDAVPNLEDVLDATVCQYLHGNLQALEIEDNS